MPSAPLISTGELKDRLATATPPSLVDVREDWEVALGHIPGSLHIPLNQIPLRLKELDASKTIIVLCKSGGRSQMAADFLKAQGFGDVWNLAGGMDAWAHTSNPA